MEMRDEVFLSVYAQGMDTSGYQVSDLDDVDLCFENDQLHVDVVFITSIDTPLSPLAFNEFEMGSMAENPILIDKEQDMENSPPPRPTIPASERPTQPSVLMKSHPLWTKIQNVPD